LVLPYNVQSAPTATAVVGGDFLQAPIEKTSSTTNNGDTLRRIFMRSPVSRNLLFWFKNGTDNIPIRCSPIVWNNFQTDRPLVLRYPNPHRALRAQKGNAGLRVKMCWRVRARTPTRQPPGTFGSAQGRLAALLERATRTLCARTTPGANRPCSCRGPRPWCSDRRAGPRLCGSVCGARILLLRCGKVRARKSDRTWHK
jgi:hypothetical protein